MFIAKFCLCGLRNSFSRRSLYARWLIRLDSITNKVERLMETIKDLKFIERLHWKSVLRSTLSIRVELENKNEFGHVYY